MASEGGGGMDLATFIVALIIFGVLIQVAYTRIAQFTAPSADTAQQETLNTTATTADTEGVPLEIQ